MIPNTRTMLYAVPSLDKYVLYMVQEQAPRLSNNDKEARKSNTK